MIVRAVRPDEYRHVGDLVADIYETGEWASPEYIPVLRDVATRAEHADVLVAADEHGQVLGTITWAPGGEYAETAQPGEGSIRMLAVADAARGRGAGEALVRECVRRAVDAHLERIVLHTQPTMYAAHRLYERLGFVRAPERDWSPVPGINLYSYVLDLRRCDRCGDVDTGDHAACVAARRLEPPRYCTRCGRRLVVQVTPTSWTARCSEHGTVPA